MTERSTFPPPLHQRRRSNAVTSDWYSQCIPSEDAEDLAQNSDIETQIITTRFDVPGPTPSVVTTYITIFTPAPQPTPQPPSVTITAVPDTPINGRKKRRSA